MGGVEDMGRSVFDTVGGVVQTLSSVSVMLQSTLFALQNSVQAVLSVANQFGHLRTNIIQMCIATIRIVKKYYRKLLYLFRLKQGASGADALWSEVAAQHADSQSGGGGGNIVLWLAIVVCTPYVMWSLIKGILAADTKGKLATDTGASGWEKGSGEHYMGEALYDYKATKNDELTLTCGDLIYIAPKHIQPSVKGWLLAACGGKKGMVPANYVKVTGKGRLENVDAGSDGGSVAASEGGKDEGDNKSSAGSCCKAK